MLHAGLDLSRRKIDVCLLSAGGEIVEEFASPPDADGLRGLTRRVGSHGVAVRGVIESMTGARFVHDRLEELGWDVLIADAAKVKGLAPLACKTDKIDARVLAVLSERDLVPEIWLPDPRVRREREQARFRMHLVKHRSMLKHRIHATARPSASSSRSHRASSRSVLARRLRPRNARVSTGSARCATAPAATNASRTNSQPVQASTATSISPSKRSTQRATAAGVASIRPRVSSPESVSSASKVICARCTSNPATIAIRASSKAPALPPARVSRAERRRPWFMPSLDVRSGSAAVKARRL